MRISRVDLSSLCAFTHVCCDIAQFSIVRSFYLVMHYPSIQSVLDTFLVHVGAWARNESGIHQLCRITLTLRRAKKSAQYPWSVQPVLAVEPWAHGRSQVNLDVPNCCSRLRKAPYCCLQAKSKNRIVSRRGSSFWFDTTRSGLKMVRFIFEYPTLIWNFHAAKNLCFFLFSTRISFYRFPVFPGLEILAPSFWGLVTEFFCFVISVIPSEKQHRFKFAVG
jgi:hypothetical protein